MIERQAVRALLLAGDTVLLIQGLDPELPGAGTWWFTPGGGIEDGETLEAAAAREVLEETGLELPADGFGPVVATRTAEFMFDGETFLQSESFFAVRVEAFSPCPDGWEQHEQRSLLQYRWWTVEEIATTTERIYPAELAALVRAVTSGTLTEPMRLSGE